MTMATAIEGRKMGSAYYNEIDPKAAVWLRELIKAGLIADGEVDERDIQDIRPADLSGFTQCHFFAGIGVWSYALRNAGWPDDRPVWTGSCPCQPFSAAGKGGGFDDERHLWPSWYWLIEQCRPTVLFGEQVASKDAEPWLDLVQADLEALAYSVGAVPFPSASVGAPHIRDRTYWLADAVPAGRREPGRECAAERAAGAGGLVGGLADAYGRQREGQPVIRGAEPDGSDAGWPEGGGSITARREDAGIRTDGRHLSDGAGASGEHGLREVALRPGPVNGLWRAADWLYCRDGNWRAVGPGTSPLAHGAPARVGRLRGYGNAINASQAQIFIEAYLEAQDVRAAA